MVTILIIVATINAVNFIDGLDGLAAGVVGISAVAYLVYSYELTNSVGIQSQSVPAVASAVLAGMCLGFLPHNFNPARIFMGDAGVYAARPDAGLRAYLVLRLAGPEPPDPRTQGAHPANRFPTILPLIIPIAIWVIPYTDMLLAVVRRTMKGHVAVRRRPAAPPPPAAEHRPLATAQTVLLMYLWTARLLRPRRRPVGRCGSH